MERRTEITKSGVKWKTMNDKVQCFIIIIIITILYIENVKKNMMTEMTETRHRD